MTRPPILRLGLDELIVDSFSGGGGASHGILLALGREPDIAINHDREALSLHERNHPFTKHYQEDVWQVDPVAVCAGRPVGLMWLSPDCKHFSKAKGGAPVSPRVRGLAWVAVRWARAVKPRVIILENVEEFQTWGPVVDGRPCPARKGRTFRAFVRALKREGYEVDWRELRACDFGAPTIRKRLFLIARRDGFPIVWPEPTHGKGRLPYRTAAECIDWRIPCPSIFGRARPLAENTLRRIAAGIRRFVIESPRPFIVQVQNASSGNAPISIDAPMRTITAHPKGGGHALVTPVLVEPGQRHGRGHNSGGAPMTTVVAKDRHALVAPVLVSTTHHGGERVESLEEPLRTVTGAQRGEKALIAPVLVPRYGEREGQAPRARTADEPMATIVPTQNGASLVSAFLAKHYTGVVGADVREAMPTVTTVDHNALVTSSLVKLKGTSQDGQPMDEPLHTVLAGGTHFAEVRAFLVAYYGNEQDGGALDEPMRTLSTRDRFGLVTVDGHEYQIADIGMRMLQPRELFRAQGFPDDYHIDSGADGRPLTKTAQVRLVGNSVCPPIAAALVRANLGGAIVRGDQQELALAGAA